MVPRSGYQDRIKLLCSLPERHYMYVFVQIVYRHVMVTSTDSQEDRWGRELVHAKINSPDP